MALLHYTHTHKHTHTHTHTRLYKAVYYIRKSILKIEYLHYKSFSNLCGIADWLIISGLNVILPCASSFIKYNIYIYDMWFCGWWTWWTFMVNEIWYLLTKKKYFNTFLTHVDILYAKVGTISPMSLTKILPTYYINKIWGPQGGVCAPLIPENNAFISPKSLKESTSAPWK